MASWTPADARVRSPALRPPAARPAARHAAERRLAGGVLWIAVLGVLLVGVVALNVAVLRLNMQLEQLGKQRLELEAENALLESRVSAAIAPPRIEAVARTRLGLVPSDAPTYVELVRARRRR